MAYLPFYLTPEEFALKQKQQEQEIAAGRDQICWHKYDIEEPNRYHNILLSLMPISVLSMMLGYFWFTSGKDTFMGVGSLVMLALTYGYCYLIFGLDYRYDYLISDLGLVVKKRRNMPRWINRASQIAAWFGAIVCVLAVSVAGPMILAGAGGLILLSFTGLKRKPDEEAEVRIGHREDWLFVFYNKKRKVIKFFHKFDWCYYSDTDRTKIFRSHSRGYSNVFFHSQSELEDMIERLSNQYQLECIEVVEKKEIFVGKIEPKLAEVPTRHLEFLKSELDGIKARKTPPPRWEYLFDGEWRTKAEIEQLQSQAKPW